MKITKRQLRRIIREEKARITREGIGEYVKDFFDPQGIFTGAGAGVDEDELRSSSTSDAWRLFKALAGLGTDEDEIERVFAMRRNAPGGLSKLADEYSMVLKNLSDQRGGLRTNAIKGALGYYRGGAKGALRDIGVNMLQKYSVSGDDLERWLRDDGEQEFADEVRNARVTRESINRHRPRNRLMITSQQLRRIIRESILTEKKGLWDNIRAKRARGEKPAKPGDKDYPDEKSWKAAQEANDIYKEPLDEIDLDEAGSIDKDRMKCNKPRYLRKGESGHGNKQKVVKACDGGKESLVKFGDAKMRNNRDKKSNKKSFRDRMNCDTPGPKTKARYWACKDW